MERLNEAALTSLPPNIARYEYNRRLVTPGIVHIGMGAFHRGHMAAYVDRILATEPNWGIIGASLRRPDTKAALEAQDYLYTLQETSASGMRHTIVGSIVDMIDASMDTLPLLDALSAASIRLVSLTVTEKGYCHDPSTGKLSFGHSDIKHDLVHPEHPRSMPGLLSAALSRRMGAGQGGFTVLSCDNVQGNGHIARNVVLDFAERLDPALAAWINQNVSFPCTMVDRIVPATSDADRDLVASALGVFDAWPIVTEAFSQWVIEDKFVRGRPPLQLAGAQLVTDVEPFELMKLRLLNGAHSSIAYLGLLSGSSLVSDTVGNSTLRTFLRKQAHDEVIPTLDMPRVDLHSYFDGLLDRFQNQSLHHRCLQIAADGSQKIPVRVLAPIRELLTKGRSPRHLALTLAAWIAYVHRSAVEQNATFADPLASKLLSTASGAKDAGVLVRDIFEIREIFGDLVLALPLQLTVAAHLNNILELGAEGAVRAVLETPVRQSSN